MKTVLTSTIIETDVKNSRFITELLPYDQLEGRLSALRTLHRKASHHVSAYRYFNDQRQLIEHGKDDGEVSGTAGGPALRALQGHDLFNCGLIIVRYFGGTKLGTGGLIRAYSEAAVSAIENAKLAPYAHQKEISLSAGFSHTSDLENICTNTSVHILDRDYNETGMVISLAGDEDRIDAAQENWEQFMVKNPD